MVPLDSLPDPALQLIVSQLGARHLAAAACTCRTMRDMRNWFVQSEPAFSAAVSVLGNLEDAIDDACGCAINRLASTVGFAVVFTAEGRTPRKRPKGYSKYSLQNKHLLLPRLAALLPPGVPIVGMTVDSVSGFATGVSARAHHLLKKHGRECKTGDDVAEVWSAVAGDESLSEEQREELGRVQRASDLAEEAEPLEVNRGVLVLLGNLPHAHVQAYWKMEGEEAAEETWSLEAQVPRGCRAEQCLVFAHPNAMTLSFDGLLAQMQRTASPAPPPRPEGEAGGCTAVGGAGADAEDHRLWMCGGVAMASNTRNTAVFAYNATDLSEGTQCEADAKTPSLANCPHGFLSDGVASLLICRPISEPQRASTAVPRWRVGGGSDGSGPDAGMGPAGAGGAAGAALPRQGEGPAVWTVRGLEPVGGDFRVTETISREDQPEQSVLCLQRCAEGEAVPASEGLPRTVHFLQIWNPGVAQWMEAACYDSDWEQRERLGRAVMAVVEQHELLAGAGGGFAITPDSTRCTRAILSPKVMRMHLALVLRSLRDRRLYRIDRLPQAPLPAPAAASPSGDGARSPADADVARRRGGRGRLQGGAKLLPKSTGLGTQVSAQEGRCADRVQPRPPARQRAVLVFGCCGLSEDFWGQPGVIITEVQRTMTTTPVGADTVIGISCGGEIGPAPYAHLHMGMEGEVTGQSVPHSYANSYSIMLANIE